VPTRDILVTATGVLGRKRGCRPGASVRFPADKIQTIMPQGHTLGTQVLSRVSFALLAALFAPRTASGSASAGSLCSPSWHF